jgi:CDP-4-dehydro-6-deoxyglucose reductase, E1
MDCQAGEPFVNPDKLKQEILSKVEEYYRLVHQGSSSLMAGTTKIGYAGRIYDEREMINVVDAALEFWLFCDLVNSGSSANLLAFMSLTSNDLGDRKVQRGDEVITVAAGFPTTVAPIVQYGAIPVFVDVDLQTLNVDVTMLELARSTKTKAVVLAHTLGNPFNVDAVQQFCRTYGLWLIEDNCDALGSTYRGRYTGTFGDIATSSFYPPHHITMGEGGAVYTNDKDLARIMESMRDWGRDCWCPSGKDNTCGKRFEHQLGELPFGYDHKYTYSHFGYNLKASDLQAAVGCAQLDKLKQFCDLRRRNYRLFREGLRPVEDRFIFVEPTPGSDPAWFGFLMIVRKDAGFSRKEAVDYLESRLIQTRMLFAGNIIKHPCFDVMRKEQSGYRVVGELVNTNRLMEEAFWVGVYPGMTTEMVEFVVEEITRFCGRSGSRS